MSNFTPGPWQINRRSETSVISADGRGVASTGSVYESDKPDRGDSENIANASLIAASPDMYEALLDAICQMECEQRPNSYVIEKAKKAVAKAKTGAGQ